MNQKMCLMVIMLAAMLVMGGIVVHDIIKNNRFGNLTHKTPNSKNWEWKDDWNSPKPQEPKPDPKPIPEDVVQIVAPSYADALTLSAKLGKPIFVYFEADWCVWCKKMKSETLSDASVKEVMKNYILVFVNVDGNRKISSKFDVRGIPSYAITNYKEDKLKTGSGYVKSDEFVFWLTNPNLYNQPKKS